MWWRELFRSFECRPRGGRIARRRLASLLVVIAAAGLTAGCWEPLYGSRPSLSSESVQDKFASIDIQPITAPKGTPSARVAVAVFNAVEFNLHNGGRVGSPAYRLTVNISSSQFTAVLNPTSGRPDAQIDQVYAS